MNKFYQIFLISICFLGLCNTAANSGDGNLIPSSVETKTFRVELIDIHPISDQMPPIPVSGPYNYLLAKLKFNNLTDHTLQFNITNTSVSYNEDGNEECDRNCVTLKNEKGLSTGETKIEIPVGEHIVCLRGNKVFRNIKASAIIKGDQKPKLYLTITLFSPEGEVILRNSGLVKGVQ